MEVIQKTFFFAEKFTTRDRFWNFLEYIGYRLTKVSHEKNTMMTKKVFNLIVLDESGSMCGIVNATLSGLNETLQSIRLAQEKHPEQEHFVTLMSFNSEGRKFHYDCTPAKETGLFDGSKYEPCSCTPLYDAIGCGIARLRRLVTDDDNVLVTIITDGLENDSHEYGYETITSLVDKLKSQGWMITYIGANQDAMKEARGLHIDNGLSFDATPTGVCAMFLEEQKARMEFYDRVDTCASPKEVFTKIAGTFFKTKTDKGKNCHE